MQTKSEIAGAVVRNSPQLTATGLTLAGVPIADWLVIITIIYTLVQLNTHLREKGYYKRWTKFILRRK